MRCDAMRWEWQEQEEEQSGSMINGVKFGTVSRRRQLEFEPVGMESRCRDVIRSSRRSGVGLNKSCLLCGSGLPLEAIHYTVDGCMVWLLRHRHASS